MIEWYDWGIWIVYFLVIFSLLWFYRLTKKESYYRYFIPAFLIKVFGSLAFTLIYVYYYGFGDSFEYFKGAYSLTNALKNSPADYIELLASESSTFFPGHLRQYTDHLAYSDSPEEWFMVKLVSPIALISFNSYLVINLFMSVISFWGGWKLFKVFQNILPQYSKWVFACVFLVPSVVFWGGGLMKDTFTLAGINYLIYVLYFGVLQRQMKWKYLVLGLFWFYITFKLKSYIIIAFIPGALFALYLIFKNSIRSALIRWVLIPFLLVLFFGIGFFGLKSLSESSGKYSTEQLEWKVKGFHSWHTSLGGSAYSLGEVGVHPSRSS